MAGPDLRRILGVVAAALLALSLAACGSSDAMVDRAPGPGAASESAAAAGTGLGSTAPNPAPTPASAGGEVVLITHDSFVLDQALLDQFQTETGITLTLLAQGDAGSMLNQLVLTKSNPLGDAVFGVDNTFASRALTEGVVEPYRSPAAAAAAEDYGLGEADPDGRLTPIDYGDVCVNVDRAWFRDRNLSEPATFEDLARPEYRDLLVVESPATSSPGLAFLFGTIAHFGEEGWQQYWTQLRDNGVKITAGWEDAYTVDFSGSSGRGDRPLVVSYASSPPAEVGESATPPAAGEAPTAAVLDTCFRQVEYAGVLAGAKNPEGARRVIDFLLAEPFQSTVAEQMYVYPVNPAASVPESWETFAPPAADPLTLDPAVIADRREEWIGAWSDLME